MNTENSNQSDTQPAFEVVSESTLAITDVVDYGHSLNDLLSGQVDPPPQGARVDIGFSGETTGKLTGTIKGVDFANVRADGRFEIDIRAEIVTPDGARIAFHSAGVLIPQADGTGKITEAVTLKAGSEKYAWVNNHTFIGEGVANPATGAIKLTMFM